MKYPEIKNWKLREAIEYIYIVGCTASSFIKSKFQELNIPEKYNEHFHRGETFIDWEKMPRYYKFFFDVEDGEEIIKEYLKQSNITLSKTLYITYLQEEVVVNIPVPVFFSDWEGFIRSTLYNAIIFSEDYSLIMEISRDYYLHSNFEIMPDSKVV